MGIKLEDSGTIPGHTVWYEGEAYIVQAPDDPAGTHNIWAKHVGNAWRWISAKALIEGISEQPPEAPAENPKQAFGDKKPPLALIPLSADIEESLALFDGANKYGIFNWRENPVEAMTYVHAAIRHLKLWAMGDERTRDTNIHNLGAVKACCTILMDAQINGTMIDNRSKSPAVCDMLHEAEKYVSELKKLHGERLTKK